MSHLNALLSDLRERKLWPLAAVLLAALVAVPVLLSSHPSATPAAPGASALPATATHSGPVVSTETTGSQAPLRRRERDPFTQQATPVAALAQTSSAATVASVSGTAAGVAGMGMGTGVTGGQGISAGSGSTGGTESGSSSAGTGSSAGASNSGGAGGSTIVAPVLPVNPPTGGKSGAGSAGAKAAATPAGLTATQSYDVELSMPDPIYDFRNFAAPRLTVVSSANHPLAFELGVLRGGTRVLFAIEPGTILTGAGTCTPGPLDCEVLSLGLNQIEYAHASGVPTVFFKVVGLDVHNNGSVALAKRARARASTAGEALLRAARLPALSLFSYDAGLGAVVDLRNLTVGGN